MAPLRVGLTALLEFRQAPTSRRLREERGVQIGRREPTNPPNYDVLAFLMPLEGGTWTDAKLPSNSSRNRDLALGGEA
jgi:hypothetical protein